MNAPRLIFNREDARQAAIACQRAYLQPSVRVGNAQAWFGWEIYNDSFWAPIGGPQTANPQSLVIGIAGTDEFGDILQDARVLNRIEVGNTGALVHRGFWAHWSTLRNELIAQLTSAVEPWPRPTRIVIAGHSLGAAALAIGLYRDAASLFPSATTVHNTAYLFGIPRVGNWRWASAFADFCPCPTFRVVNANDVVARSPRSLVPGRWVDVAQEVYLDRHGRHHLTRPPDYFRDRLLGRLNDLGRLGPSGLNDHRISSYIEALSCSAASKGGILAPTPTAPTS